MKILFTNSVLKSTISAVHANTLYPISNIKDSFLKKIFKSTSTTETITISLASVQSINCFFIGFTNATVATIKMYDSGASLLSTKTIDISRGGSCFPVVNYISYMTVELTSTENIYIGNIATGFAYTMPNPDNDIVKKFVDNSTMYESSDGQRSINKSQVLRFIDPSFSTIDDIDIFNEIYNYMVMIDRPVWIDCFENTSNIINPMYATISFKVNSKSDRIRKISFEATEAR